MIKRDVYIDRIRPFMRKNIAKVLTGQRRVGKSFILYQLMRQIAVDDPKANIIYVNLEDFTHYNLRTATDLNDYITSQLQPSTYNYIFIDEIQEVPEFERVVRSLLLNPSNDIYITGSNANMLSSELSTYLSGRYVEFTVHSLSYVEFLSFHNLDDSDESLHRYTRYGGLPYLVNLQLTDGVVDEYLKSVYSTIVYRDVVGRYNLRNSDLLERLLRFLADNIGNLFSSKSISDYLKAQKTAISVVQIKSYTNYLASSYLINAIERYDLVGKRIFDFGEKYYFENLGLRNVVAGYRTADDAKLLENLVYNHLVYRQYRVCTGQLGSVEIDFIAERDDEKLYIQVALRIDSEATAQREYGNLLKIADNYPKYIITADPHSGSSYNGIRHLTIRQFLLNF